MIVLIVSLLVRGSGFGVGYWVLGIRYSAFGVRGSGFEVRSQKSDVGCRKYCKYPFFLYILPLLHRGHLLLRMLSIRLGLRSACCAHMMQRSGRILANNCFPDWKASNLCNHICRDSAF
jgi:hypothetical protein